MFGGGLFNDPFFGGMHQQMRRQMEAMDNLMDNMMMDPFAAMHHGQRGMAQRMLEGGPPRGSGQLARRRRDPFEELLSPFGGGPMGMGGGLIGGMERMRAQALSDPNSHVYSQSTVLRFGPDGVVESTDSVRKAGDAREVRHSVRNSTDGEERLEIGHHLGGRAHVIEKRRGPDGRIRETQRFQGLNQDEAHAFDSEWAARTGLGGSRSGGGRSTGRLSFPSPSRRRTVEAARGSGPIITEVDDDADADAKRRRGAEGAQYSSSSFRPNYRKRQQGPVIEEVE